MCFTQEMSLFFSLSGCLMSSLLWYKQAYILSSCIFYFTSMEILQVVQYSYIADSLTDPKCNNFMNQILTTVGVLHICFQPYILNTMVEYSIQSGAMISLFKQRFVMIKRLCIIAGSWLFYRHMYAMYDKTSYTNSHLISTEWIQH